MAAVAFAAAGRPAASGPSLHYGKEAYRQGQKENSALCLAEGLLVGTTVKTSLPKPQSDEGLPAEAVAEAAI